MKGDNQDSADSHIAVFTCSIGHDPNFVEQDDVELLVGPERTLVDALIRRSELYVLNTLYAAVFIIQACCEAKFGYDNFGVYLVSLEKLDQYDRCYYTARVLVWVKGSSLPKTLLIRLTTLNLNFMSLYS
jgi:hypothetical protein